MLAGRPANLANIPAMLIGRPSRQGRQEGR
jgi:hypothetical protein